MIAKSVSVADSAASAKGAIDGHFDLQEFVQSFDVLAEAPGGPERLRKLVLDLAIRGQLTGSCPGDGPAVTLLDAARYHREARIKRGEIRNGEDLGPVVEDDEPFPLPTNWTWTRIGSAMNLINGRAFKPSEWSISGLPIVRIQNLNNPAAPFNYCAREVEPKFHLRTGDFLISWSGTPGTSFGAFIWSGPPGLVNQHIFRAELYGGGYEPRFLRVAINARLDEMIARAHGGVGLQHITKGKLEALPIPLPPLAEQNRIVAKVDELMRLLDDLEAKQTKQRETQARLRSAALDALTSAEGPEELAAAWKRVADSFAVLFERVESVGDLRRQIIDLGLRGALLDAPGSSVFEEGVPYCLPHGWVWTRLGAVAQFINGDRSKNYPSKRHRVPTGIPFINAGHLRNGAVDFTEMNYITEETFNVLRSGKVREGDVLYCLRGSLGKSGVVTGMSRGAIASSLVIMRPERDRLSERYLLRYCDSSLGQSMIRKYDNGTAQPNLSATDVAKYLVPLPPLAEQKRIVAKVEHLIKLCDDLEAKLRRANERAGELVEAVVAEFVAA